MRREPSDTPQAPNALGRAIRTRRRTAGLTLVQLAEMTRLSQPFLSQIERGSAQPSMRSLEEIARALKTTGPTLLAAHDNRPETSFVTPASGGLQVPNAAGGTARMLAPGRHDLLPMEFLGGPAEFEGYLQHDGEEFLYVVAGRIELDLDGELQELEARDSAYFPGATPHRWRALGSEQVWVLGVANGAH